MMNQGLSTVFRTLVPSQVQEQELSVLPYDKVFASAWLDDDSIICGTKCNRLVCIQANASKQPKLVEIPMPERPNSKGLGWIGESQCGVHSIAVNPGGDMLVTGGMDPSDCVVYKLPSLTPVQTFVGHSDWAFGVTWVSNDMFVSGSRDSTVKLWKVGGCDGRAVNDEPVCSRSAHAGKVRDLRYSVSQGYMATLSSDETCKIWDPHMMSVTRSYDLFYSKELVCLAVQDETVAVGSQSFISLYDTRQPAPIEHIRSLDDGWGVRSISFLDHMMTCGGGQGRISFYDRRAGRYLELSRPLAGGAGVEASPFLQTGKGWLDKNEVYQEHFAGQEVNNACYSHCWHPSGTKLFTGGGPLPFGLRGCYAAIWR